MTYTKQTWTNGDIITAEKLNHMEDGIESAESAVFFITLEQSGETYTIDKTMAEIMSAYDSGLIPIVKYGNNFLHLINLWNDSDGDVVEFGNMTRFFEGDHVEYTTTSFLDEGDDHGTYVQNVNVYNIPLAPLP